MDTRTLASQEGVYAAHSHPWTLAVQCAAAVLGPAESQTEHYRWDVSRADGRPPLRVELFGTPRLMATIVDLSKSGLHAMRVIDLYDPAAVSELREVLRQVVSDSTRTVGSGQG